MSEDTDSDMLVVVRLNCGEPVSVTTSHRSLKNIPVVFLETSEMADELDNPVLVADDEVVAKVGKIRHEDMEELFNQLEDAGVL
jgi:hypothetical protein